ncbi:MAG: YjbQ family protein [Candidatus Lokiarchaeota archaeon]|nr:YjbQ family protein [Candidatus Lokiarchaeota archaeon]
MHEIEINTSKKEEILDITNNILNLCKQEEIFDGICYIYIPHTTAGISINENADPAVKKDILKILKHIIPGNLNYEHAENNSPAHAKAMLCGFSIEIFIENGALNLGTWQGIYFCEFDGPRRRYIHVKFIRT